MLLAGGRGGGAGLALSVGVTSREQLKTQKNRMNSEEGVGEGSGLPGRGKVACRDAERDGMYQGSCTRSFTGSL